MYVWGFLAAIATMGHFALHLVIYNRVNATGLPRWQIKIIKYAFFGTCLAIPIATVTLHWDLFEALLNGRFHPRMLPWPLWIYMIVTWFTVGFYGPDWLLSRPSLNRDAIDAPARIERQKVQQCVDTPLALTAKCRTMAAIPINQIFELAVEQKELHVVGLPVALDGFRVAHLSDVHLTGHVSPAFYRHAIEQALAWSPDIIALTGDVVDKKRCIEWLGDCFGAAQAKHGCYFVLGNHDLRVPDPNHVRDAMKKIGWTNLGTASHSLNINGLELQLLGNESPWFPAPEIDPEVNSSLTFRLLLSHSPDQIDWARNHTVGLMLAGHTHGGQGRLPWVGPVLSPSYHGSRYASGTFYLAPTTMHVTRGLSGVHLMRINCPPELALLTLRAQAVRR